jgi:nitroreductase
MQRLFVGDAVSQVRAAIGDDPAAAATDQYLLVSVKFWKNSFKYNSFCYHVVTMDVGTLLGTWQLWSRAHGLALRPALTFDEPALNRLLGLHTESESTFAVVPLLWSGADTSAAGSPTPSRPPDLAPRVSIGETERSRTVLRFPTIEEVHAAIVDAGAARPAPAVLAAGAAGVPAHDKTEVQALPAPARLDVPVAAALRARRSSFGRFSGHPPLTTPALSAILAAGAAGGRLVSDIKRPDGTPSLTRLVAFVNHVQGIARGVYDYDPARNSLGVVSLDDVGLFLQRNYFLPNYNLEQAAAALVVLARPEAVIDAVGPRGYRFVNAEVGAVAQSVYTACAALGVGCGAALGFDNVSYSERLNIVGTGEWPLLLLMIGNERAGEPNFDYWIN